MKRKTIRKTKIGVLIISLLVILSICGCANNSSGHEKKGNKQISSDNKKEQSKKVDFGDIELKIPKTWTVSTDDKSTTIKPDDSGDFSVIAFYLDVVPSMGLDLNLTLMTGSVAGKDSTNLKTNDVKISKQPAKELEYIQPLSGHNVYIHGYLFPVKDKLAYVANAEKDTNTRKYDKDFQKVINSIVLPQNTFTKENKNEEPKDKEPDTEKPKTESVPTEYTSAFNKARRYSETMHMSKQKIYDQLVSQYGEKFSPEAAQYAVDNLKADYNANALAKAKSYQKTMNMSPERIRDQLTSEYGEKFTQEEADYAIGHLND